MDFQLLNGALRIGDIPGESGLGRTPDSSDDRPIHLPAARFPIELASSLVKLRRPESHANEERKRGTQDCKKRRKVRRET